MLRLKRAVTLAVSLAAHGLGATEFNLATVEALALERDAGLAGLSARAESMSAHAVAAAQLPDPKLKLGLNNFPTDSFDRRQEPMTQVRLGVVQAFPPAGTLAHRGERSNSLADAAKAAVVERRLGVLRKVRQTYLDLYFQSQALRIVAINKRLFRQLVEVTEQQYAAGTGTQQDVAQAQLQLSLLEDREASRQSELEQARAALVRWLGEAPAGLPVAVFPPLPEPLEAEDIEQQLPRHPLIVAADQRLAASGYGVALAEDRYKPGWSLDVTYGSRRGDAPQGGDRADFLSAMVMLDLPLFPAKRQDRTLAARRAEQRSARYGREDQLRRLQAELAGEAAAWQRLDERVMRYDEQILDQAALNTEAALNAYRSGLREFNNLMLARVSEFQARIDHLRLRVDRAKRQVSLLYLQGEAS